MGDWCTGTHMYVHVCMYIVCICMCICTTDQSMYICIYNILDELMYMYVHVYTHVCVYV